MEDKLVDKLIKKEIKTCDKSQLPPSVELKLNKAYEAIKSDKVDIKTVKKHNKKKFALAASLTIGFLTIASFNPVLAEKIPVLNEITKELKKIYWFNDNYISNASEININQKDQGIEIDLEGVIYDESSIKFIYTLSSDKKLQWGVQMRNSSLKINGKELLLSNGMDISGERKLSDETKISNTDDKIEKYAVVTTFDISDCKLDDNVEINWEPKEIHTFDGSYTKGNWKFDFKVSKETLKRTSKIVNTNYTIEKDGYKKSIDKIIFTSTETKIVEKEDGKLTKDIVNAYADLEKNSDNKEKQDYVNKLNKINNDLDAFSYKITDEKGNELKMLNGKGHTDEKGGYFGYIFMPVKEIPSKLTFAKLESDDDKAAEIPLKDIKTPFQLMQGENMSVTVNSIENSNGDVKINATFNGGYIATRVYGGMMVVPKSLSSDSGLYKADKETSKNDIFNYYLKADKDNNTFDFNFKIDPAQDYVVRVKNSYTKGSEFTIDLNK